MTTTPFKPTSKLATANRCILAMGAGLLAILLPLLYIAPGTKLAAIVFAFEAALCLALFFIKHYRRAAIWGNWEATTQTALLRNAFQESEEPAAVFLEAA